MAKTAISKRTSLSAYGILDINENGVFLEVENTGEIIDFRQLLKDFSDKTIELSVNFDNDFE